MKIQTNPKEILVEIKELAADNGLSYKEAFRLFEQTMASLVKATIQARKDFEKFGVIVFENLDEIVTADTKQGGD